MSNFPEADNSTGVEEKDGSSVVPIPDAMSWPFLFFRKVSRREIFLRDVFKLTRTHVKYFGKEFGKKFGNRPAPIP